MRTGPAAGTHQIVENASVESPLVGTALPHLLVVVVQAFPVGSELFKTVGVDVLDTAPCHVSVRPHILSTIPPQYRASRCISCLPCGPPTPRPTTGCTLKVGERVWTGDYTHTLLAHLVTLRPSFMHSNSPLPGLSVLHFI